MKSVSNAYKLSMRGLLRNRSYVRITFGNVDTTAATDGEWVSNGELPFLNLKRWIILISMGVPMPFWN